jgi:prepilin-type processing-associated H-X9-DG protein
LVVIGVIALLIGVLLPALANARRHARDVACMANLRQIGAAFRIYATDSKDLLPPPEALYPGNRFVPWQVALWRYLVKRDPPQLPSGVPDKHEYLLGTIFICPQGIFEERTKDYASMGYAMNEDLPELPRYVAGPRNKAREYKRISKIKDASQTLLAADGRYLRVGARSAGDKDGIMTFTGEGNVFDAVALPQFQDRHRRKVNTLMADGSVRGRVWYGSEQEIPIPPRNAGDDPASYPPNVQIFWFGRMMN